ncbi:MAG: ABC transporter permease [Armatimonadota bacterium]
MSRTPRWTRESAIRRLLRLLGRDRGALAGAVLFAVVVLAAVFAGALSRYDPVAVRMQDRLQLPSARHLLGTDELGRDVLTRILYGARASLSVGVIAVAIAGTIGTVLGLAAGFYGGYVNTVIMRGVDGLLAFPALILAMALTATLGPSLGNAAIAIGIVSIPVFARLAQASALAIKEREFTDAARASGASDRYVLLRVLLPNHLSPLLVQASVSFANAILTEAALSFLGLGVRPPTPSWGAMLDTGRRYLDQTAWYSVSAGGAILVAVMGLNLLGDGLRDALDPRLRGMRASVDAERGPGA